MVAKLRGLLRRVSLAARITALIVVVMTLGLALAGVGTLSIIRDSLVASIDARLERALADFSQQPITQTQAPEQCGLAQTMPNTFYLGVSYPDGTVICDNKLPSPTNPDLSSLTLPVVAGAEESFTVPTIDGSGQWRVVAAPTQVEDSGEVLITLVAQDLLTLESTTASFTIVFIGFSLLAVILGAALTRILAVSTLRDLRRVALQAERFADGDYETRVASGDPRTEVGSLQQSLNAMLERIEVAIEERERAVAQMRQFVGDASHELRTPLVSVRGYAELYRMGAISKPEDVQNAMERIEGEAKRMAALVEDLLLLARLDERRPLELEPLDLVPLVNDAASDARVTAPDRAIAVRAIEPDAARPVALDHEPVSTGVFTPPPMAPPAVVLGDEHRLRQVISNLIGNAMRYTKEGTPIELGVGVSPRRREAVVHVIDHGDGVPEAIRRKIFQRFFRADTSRTRETGGSGLGLAIVQGILRAHTGRIDVVETEGGGATFRIAIPLASEAALFEYSQRLRSEHTTTSGSNPHPSPRPHR